MHNADHVSGVNSVRDLTNDGRDLVGGKRSVLLRVAFEKLSGSPFDGQKMHPRRCFANLDGLNDIRVLDTLAIAGFAYEARYSRLVLTKLFAQDLHGNDPVRRMLRTEDGRCSALPDFAAEGISRQRSTYQVLFRHVANLTSFSRA